MITILIIVWIICLLLLAYAIYYNFKLEICLINYQKRWKQSQKKCCLCKKSVGYLSIQKDCCDICWNAVELIVAKENLKEMEEEKKQIMRRAKELVHRAKL